MQLALSALRMVVSASLAATFLAGCRPSHAAARASPDPADAALPVRVAPVERAPVRQPIRAAGTLAARDERDLSFKVGGIVARVAVREGERVEKGQILAALDATEIGAGARQAREALAKARRDRDRARWLRDQGSIARVAAEDAETGAELAGAAARAAEFNLRSATLVAPDDGWVDRRLVEPGEVVAPGHAVLRVSGRGGGFVFRASLPDRDILGLAPGAPATVSLDAGGEPIAGRVADVARSAARGTGTYQVEIRLDPSRSEGLLSGLTAKAEIERPARIAPAVPLAALQDGDGERGAVFAIEGGRARRVPVRIAFLKDGLAVLADRLEGVDSVATDGAHRLVDGAHVRLVP
jgi:membrane fusion protein, multidrug efflux system